MPLFPHAAIVYNDNRNGLVWESDGLRLLEFDLNGEETTAHDTYATTRGIEEVWRDSMCKCLEEVDDLGVFFIEGNVGGGGKKMDKGKFICLYGGQDQKWIQAFTATAMDVAKAGGFELEMIYAGKCNAKLQMQEIINLFARYKFSHYWPNVTSIWFFWARLESMLYSKLQHGKTLENDHIMREVMGLLSLDGTDQEWAIFSRGSSEIVTVKGDTALNSLRNFDEWKHNVKRDGLVLALYDYIQKLQSQPHCNRLFLPGGTVVPEKVLCADCGREMEMYICYRCCDE